MHHKRMWRYGRIENLDKFQTTGTPPKYKLPKHLAHEQWIIWAAGFCDGEGSISMFPLYRGNSYALCLTITQINPYPLKICQALFGGTIGLPKTNRRVRPIYNWRVYCSQAADALREMLPYLVVKQEEAQLGLQFHATINNDERRISDNKKALRQQIHDKLKELKHHSYSL